MSDGEIIYAVIPTWSNTTLESILAKNNICPPEIHESQHEIHPTETVRTFMPLTIEIFNIKFALHQGEDGYTIESSEWHSLSSFGITLKEAVENMIDLVKEVLSEYLQTPENELSSDARELRNYLLSQVAR
jgi:predicted RNase H-like HicB family nuclease